MNITQLLAQPAVASVFTFVRERRYYVVAATLTGLVLVYYTTTSITKRRKNINASKDAESTHARTHAQSQAHDDSPAQDLVKDDLLNEKENTEVKSDVLESIVVHKREDSIDLAVSQTSQESLEGETKEQKAKRKKAKLKQTVIDGIGLVMGDSAGKMVESIIEITKTAKKSGGLEALLKSGKIGKLFSKDIIPFLKKKLQNKKFPSIIGTTDSPFGDLHYEVSGITLESLDIDPSLQCDITDGSEALQIKVLISSALLKNITWKCGTSKIKEKGTANAVIEKAVNPKCLFRISIDKSQPGIPRLSIKHCSIDLQQFNLELKGGKASWIYNKLTSVFNNKIKTKLKEKIDKTLTKKCAMFENKINFAASKVFSLLGKGKKSKEITAPPSVPNKKCFLYANETHNEELECVLLNLSLFSEVADLRVAFFGEVGLPHLAQSTQHIRVRFRDRSGTLISISKSTTISQIIEHAEYVCFYRESLSSSLSSSFSSATSLSSSSYSPDSFSTSTTSFASLSSSFSPETSFSSSHARRNLSSSTSSTSSL